MAGSLTLDYVFGWIERDKYIELLENDDMRDLTKHPSTEELATEAFQARERVRALEVMNTPADYEDRKKAAVELAVAREAAFYAQRKLDERLSGK
jgi:hypothetical protein